MNGEIATAIAVITATFADGNVGPSPMRTLMSTPWSVWTPSRSLINSAMPHAATPADRDPERDGKLTKGQEHQRDADDGEDGSQGVDRLGQTEDVVAEVVDREEEVGVDRRLALRPHAEHDDRERAEHQTAHVDGPPFGRFGAVANPAHRCVLGVERTEFHGTCRHPIGVRRGSWSAEH